MNIVKVILGVATALIMSALITLGIKAFYPEPQAPRYDELTKPMVAREFNCEKTDAACIRERDAYYVEQLRDQEMWRAESRVYEDAMKVYTKNLFIIANIVGIIIFVGAFWALTRIGSVAYSSVIGVMVAGLWSILYGYARGWGSVGDKTKFGVGLVVAALVIGGSITLLQQYMKKKHS